MKRGVESQQENALEIRFLRALLCSKGFFNHVYNRKMLIGKRSSILDKVYINYDQLSHSVHRTACKMCQCSSIDKFVLPRATGVLSISGQIQHL